MRERERAVVEEQRKMRMCLIRMCRILYLGKKGEIGFIEKKM